jgi:hypothetical protein
VREFALCADEPVAVPVFVFVTVFRADLLPVAAGVAGTSPAAGFIRLISTRAPSSDPTPLLLRAAACSLLRFPVRGGRAIPLSDAGAFAPVSFSEGPVFGDASAFEGPAGGVFPLPESSCERQKSGFLLTDIDLLL